MCYDDMRCFYLFTRMKPVQEIFDRLQEKKQQAKIISRKYKDELATSHEYTKVQEELEKLRTKKKAYEKSVKEQTGANFARLEELKFAIKADAQMLSDVAVTSIMKGERIEIKDSQSQYEPVFSVRFKRIT